MKACTKKNLLIAVSAVYCILSLAATGAVAQNTTFNKSAAQIDKDTNKTLQRFYKEVNGAKELTSKAKALLVMSGVTKAGFIAGGQYGQGALRIGGKTVGYYNLVSGSYGFTFGAEQMDIVIAFMTQEALNQFRKVSGWEVGVDGNVALVDVGGGKRLDTTSLQDPVVAFVFDTKGLMVDVSLKGAKFTKLKK